MNNRFFIWFRGSPTASEMSPAEIKRTSNPSDTTYFCCILGELDRQFAHAGITFLMTWNLDLFDERFDDAIVLLIGDERYQQPAYISRVRAVFKTGGVRRNPMSATIELPLAIAWRVGLRDLRNQMLFIQRQLRHRWPGSNPAPMYEIPLGTFALKEVPFVPIEHRQTDVFFAGSIPEAHRRSIRPSIAARRTMADALRHAEAEFPDWRFVHSLTVRGGDMYGADEYSQKMMNSKIALCPRGNFDETFRLLEAAKCRCVIITEPLPARWYYQGSPAVQIRGWRELVPVLRQFHSEPNRLLSLSQRTGEWWDQRLSEKAVARYAGDRLASIFPSAKRNGSIG